MPSRTSSIEPDISKLAGKQVHGVALDGDKRLNVAFSDGTILVVRASIGRLAVEVKHEPGEVGSANVAPTKRQIEYLLFIAKYIRRFGRAPAESDIERHFLVSAPTVNQMMRTLERRGFISRKSGVPRSIKICVDLGLYGTN